MTPVYEETATRYVVFSHNRNRFCRPYDEIRHCTVKHAKNTLKSLVNIETAIATCNLQQKVTVKYYPYQGFLAIYPSRLTMQRP